MQVVLSTEHVAVEIRDPLSSARRDVEVLQSTLNIWSDTVPIETRIRIYYICRRRIPTLSIHADLFKFMIQGIGLSQVLRIAKLSNQISRSHERALLVCLVICFSSTHRKLCEINGTRNPPGVEKLTSSNALHYKKFGPFNVVGKKCSIG